MCIECRAHDAFIGAFVEGLEEGMGTLYLVTPTVENLELMRVHFSKTLASYMHRFSQNLVGGANALGEFRATREVDGVQIQWGGAPE